MEIKDLSVIPDILATEVILVIKVILVVLDQREYRGEMEIRVILAQKGTMVQECLIW
jgi:hypothetical protein